MALGRWMLDAFGRIQIEKHWVQVEGHQMHCLKAGAGPELILLHGLLGTASTWELTIPRLAEESTVYAVDALGIGESERVPGIDAGLEAQAGRMVEFMDAVGHPLRGFPGHFSRRRGSPDAGRKIPGPGQKSGAARAGQSLLSSWRPPDQLLSHRVGNLVRAPHCHSAGAHAGARPGPHVRRSHSVAGRFPGKVHRLPAGSGNRRLCPRYSENLV